MPREGAQLGPCAAMLRSSEGRYSGSADCEAEGLVGWQAPMRGALVGRAASRLSGQEGSQ